LKIWRKMEAVWTAEKESVESVKMTAAQRSAGHQERRKDFIV